MPSMSANGWGSGNKVMSQPAPKPKSSEPQRRGS